MVGKIVTNVFTTKSLSYTVSIIITSYVSLNKNSASHAPN